MFTTIITAAVTTFALCAAVRAVARVKAVTPAPILIKNYRTTELQNYRTTELQNYRTTELQNYPLAQINICQSTCQSLYAHFTRILQNAKQSLGACFAVSNSKLNDNNAVDFNSPFCILHSPLPFNNSLSAPIKRWLPRLSLECGSKPPLSSIDETATLCRSDSRPDETFGAERIFIEDNNGNTRFIVNQPTKTLFKEV